MTKIRPAVQISLESLYHHVKLFQFSGKFVQTNFGNHILHLHSSGTDILVEGPFFSFRNTKRSYFEVYLIKRSQRNLLKRGRTCAMEVKTQVKSTLNENHQRPKKAATKIKIHGDVATAMKSTM